MWTFWGEIEQKSRGHNGPKVVDFDLEPLGRFSGGLPKVPQLSGQFVDSNPLPTAVAGMSGAYAPPRPQDSPA